MDTFDEETVDANFEDLHLTLKRASSWNTWNDEEILMQLAGHLRKTTWDMLSSEDKTTLEVAAETLHVRLEVVVP